VGSDAEDVRPTAGVLDDKEDVEPVQGDRVDVEQVTGRMAWACTRRNCVQSRRGAGSIPAVFSIFQTVEAPIWYPSPASSPWMRR
jgi:hypothetical protein